MSIFKSKTCELPHCNNEAAPNKKRCKRCSERYDAQGVAYILYCDFHRFDKPGKGWVTFWVHDGFVQKTPAQFSHLQGCDTTELYQYMIAIKREFVGVEKASIA